MDKEKQLTEIEQKKQERRKHRAELAAQIKGMMHNVFTARLKALGRSGAIEAAIEAARKRAEGQGRHIPKHKTLYIAALNDAIIEFRKEMG